MKGYKYDKRTYKVECSNCLIIITDKLNDNKGRNVCSIQIKPDKYAGEHKNKLVLSQGNCRVITLKKKN